MKKVLILLLCFLISLVFISCGNTDNNVVSVDGKFYEPIESTDKNGITDIYYQFKSNDDKVWWFLSANEIGFIPEYEVEYILTYNNNGTTAENKVCDCAPEVMCECEVYDDVFISVEVK